METTTDEILSPTQAAALVGVSELTLRRWLSANKIPSFKVGASRRLYRRDLDAAITAQRTPGHKERVLDADPPIDPETDWDE
ncbi:MAG: helix-turn-helix domain-containing protein [Chloroflexota bacterium]|nr:helix-turn-helix domain-containing protein [Chloroflexota bacterium]